MPVPAQDARARANPDTNCSTIGDGPQQLALGLLFRIGQWEKPPPERGLFRELIDIAVPRDKSAVLAIGSKTIRAQVVHHVGWVLYGRSNSAGIIPDFTVDRLATDARLGPRSVSLAIQLYRQWGIVRTTRPHGRRQPAQHRLNVGGLDWPALRKRAGEEAAERAQQKLDFHQGPEPTPAKLPGEWRPGDGTQTAEYRPGDGTQYRPLDGTQGLRTYEGYVRTPTPPVSSISSPPVAAIPEEHRSGQQQPDERPETKIAGNENRLDGLVAFLAVRHRQLGRPFDEAGVRGRLASGEIGVADLQRQADELGPANRREAHRIEVTYSGTRCRVCGISRPDPAEWCPGPPAEETVEAAEPEPRRRRATAHPPPPERKPEEQATEKARIETEMIETGRWYRDSTGQLRPRRR